MITKYSLMKESNANFDSNGDAYPDIMTFDIANFRATRAPIPHRLTQTDVERFDILMANFYGNSRFDLFLLFLNGVDLIHRKNPLDTFNLYDPQDVSGFVRKALNVTANR